MLGVRGTRDNWQNNFRDMGITEKDIYRDKGYYNPHPSPARASLVVDSDLRHALRRVGREGKIISIKLPPNSPLPHPPYCYPIRASLWVQISGLLISGARGGGEGK